MRQGCLARVFHAMSDSSWHTLRSLSLATDIAEATVSARIRDLRKMSYGGYRVDRARLFCAEKGRPVWHYKLFPDVARFNASPVSEALQRATPAPAPVPSKKPRRKTKRKPRVSVWEQPLDMKALVQSIMLDTMPAFRRMAFDLVANAGRK